VALGLLAQLDALLAALQPAGSAGSGPGATSASDPSDALSHPTAAALLAAPAPRLATLNAPLPPLVAALLGLADFVALQSLRQRPGALAATRAAAEAQTAMLQRELATLCQANAMAAVELHRKMSSLPEALVPIAGTAALQELAASGLPTTSPVAWYTALEQLVAQQTRA